MDLNELDLAEMADGGADLELEHPVTGELLDHEGKKFIITLAGTDSAAYRNKQRELQSKRIAKMSRKRNNKDFILSDEDTSALLAAATIGWSGIMVGGEEIEFSTAAAKKLYLERNWIREQVDVFVGDRANFFTK